MVEKTKKLIRIDLNQFKLHLYLKSDAELTLHFDSPSRKFYLSVIGLAVHEMKKRGKITSISLQANLDILTLLNKTVGASAGSSKKEFLLPRVYRKWKDALPDLENAPLFKVVGRKKRYEDSIDKIYGFSEGEKDSWANLFEYKGSHENVRLRFSIDRLGASLDDVIIVYGDNPELANEDAWEDFVAFLKGKLEDKSRSMHANGEQKEPILPKFSQRRWLRLIPSRWMWPVLSALIGLVLVVVAFAVWKTHLFAPKVEVASVEKMAFPLPDKPSIAVLPFLNMSDDPKQDYFSDGLTEEIITGLSKFPHIFVISRSSMFTYKGKDVKVQKVSEELGVQYVLEGSVRKFENRVKITAQLIDAIKGHHLWAERYDRELKNIFALQDEITLNILRSLRFQLTEGEKDSLRGKYTNNLQAYLKALEGSGHLREFNIGDSLRCFEEARTIDPQFAGAYALEALSHLFNVWYGPSSTHVESIIKAIENAKKCAEIDDELAYCNMALALTHLYNREFIDAMSEAKRAVERLPNSSDAATCLAQSLIADGRYEEALREIERAIRLDPSSPIALTILGLTYFKLGRTEEAISICKKAVALSSRFLPAHKVMILVYNSEGRKDEVRSVVNDILKIRPGFSAKDFRMMFWNITAVEVDTILNGLLKDGLN